MKNMLSIEWNRLLSIKSGADLYRIFFRLVQVITVISLIYLLLFLVPTYWQLINLEYSLPIMGYSWLLISFVYSLAQLFFAEYSLRSIESGGFSGTLIGLIMSLLFLPSACFFLGFFGLYCFLNQAYQVRHLKNSPEPFRNFLTAIQLNKISKVE